MSNILRNIEQPALIEAIEANFIEQMAWFGRALPQAELHKTPELLWLYTGKGNPNGVISTRFVHSEHDYLQTHIEKIQAYYRERGVPFTWSVGPSTRPAFLADVLQKNGFIQRSNTRGMALEIAARREDVQVNTELVISEIQDVDMLETLKLVEKEGFETSGENAQYYIDIYRHAGFGHSLPWHHYIGWLNDTPVAKASLLYHAGVAGIYGVATRPEARRKGIGVTMTLHVLREAQATGYSVAILSSTDMSEAIYRRIGFEHYCTIDHYLSFDKRAGNSGPMSS